MIQKFSELVERGTSTSESTETQDESGRTSLETTGHRIVGRS